jgi:predicted PurR-regulated permease PerM
MIQVDPKRFGLSDWFFFSILILLSVLFFNMIAWIIVDIIMALVLAYLCHSLNEFFIKKVHLPNSLSSLLCVASSLVGIVIPMFLIGLLIYSELFHLGVWMKSNWPLIHSWFTVAYWDSIYGNTGWWRNIVSVLDQVQIGDQLASLLGSGSQYALKFMNRIVVDSGLAVFHIIIVMILQFFVIKDQTALIKYIQKLSPLKEEDESELFSETTRIVDATIYGTIVLGLVEGTFGGLLFLIFGLPSPVLWAVVMMLFSILPFIGIQAVIIPTVIILLLNGLWMKALLLLVVAQLGSLFTQQYLRPYLIGTRGGMNPGMVLVCILGGFSGFGVLGFIMGPIIGSIVISMWNQFARHYSEEINAWGRGKQSIHK